MSSRSTSAINFSRAGNAMYNAAGFKVGKPNAFELYRLSYQRHLVRRRTGWNYTFDSNGNRVFHIVVNNNRYTN